MNSCKIKMIVIILINIVSLVELFVVNIRELNIVKVKSEIV